MYRLAGDYGIKLWWIVTDKRIYDANFNTDNILTYIFYDKLGKVTKLCVCMCVCV